jgi:hypothetical protein
VPWGTSKKEGLVRKYKRWQVTAFSLMAGMLRDLLGQGKIGPYSKYGICSAGFLACAFSKGIDIL